MIKEDMEFMGPVRMKDVEEAQQKIVSVIRKLEDAGEIVISRGGGDEIIAYLYKQYFVHNEPDKTRVINSNDIVEKRLEKMAELKRMEQKTTDGNGFSAGIVGPDTDYVEEIDHTAEAKKEAEKILAEAHAQAETILNQADQEAENIRENAKNTGYQEGRQCLESELAAQREQLQNEYQRKQETLQDEFREKQKNMEKDLVDVILEVFNKVFHIQFDNKKHILMYLIDDAILNIEGDKKFRIKVANSNVMFLENHKEEILERVGAGIEIEIVADSSMDGNSCVIETDSGVFDCSLGVQLENLIKDIKSLCL